MHGIIIFDCSNDIIYNKMDVELQAQLKSLAISQELVVDTSTEEDYLNHNVLMQFFSPIVNSQRIMFCQFDNTYTSIQCDGGLNFVFDEFLGYLFLYIGTDSVDLLRRKVGISISFAKHICGPNLFILKTMPEKADLLTDLLNTWEELYKEDQGFLLEAVEQLGLNQDLRSITSKTLEAVSEKLKQDPHSQRSHSLLFIDKKFLGLYSSRSAQKISSSDILFLSLLSKNLQSKVNHKAVNIQSHLLFLQGQINSGCSGCIPHIVHTSILDKGVTLILLVEYGSVQVASNLYDTFFALQKTQNIQMQGDLENLKASFENLDFYVKQTLDFLKKAKYNNQDIGACTKKFTSKWEVLKKKYHEYLKNSDKELVVKIESNMPAFTQELKELFRLTCIECECLDHGYERVSEISTLVEEMLMEFSEFLSVKAQANLSLSSYIEEFPGLIHFIYIDRTAGRITAPDLQQKNRLLPKHRVWAMVEFSRSYVLKGHTSLIWRDTALNYAYFLWFEDQTGTAIKPKELPNNTNSSVRPQYEPGILAGDFYQRLSEQCFPKTSPDKIKCYELYCVHLGLVTASCVLEQCRRLAATIGDIMDETNPDLI